MSLSCRNGGRDAVPRYFDAPWALRFRQCPRNSLLAARPFRSASVSVSRSPQRDRAVASLAPSSAPAQAVVRRIVRQGTVEPPRHRPSSRFSDAAWLDASSSFAAISSARIRSPPASGRVGVRLATMVAPSGVAAKTQRHEWLRFPRRASPSGPRPKPARAAAPRGSDAKAATIRKTAALRCDAGRGSSESSPAWAMLLTASMS